MYVECVKRHSKYAVRDHNIFAHNFLNIQLIFNPIKVLESWDLGLSNYAIKCYVCWKIENMQTGINTHNNKRLWSHRSAKLTESMYTLTAVNLDTRPLIG